MNKQEYIKIWNYKNSKTISEFKNGYKIDNDYIYHNWKTDNNDNWLKYKIDDIVILLNFYNEAKTYIKNLQKNNKIYFYCYGKNEYGEIAKISYKRKLNSKGQKIISSITVKKIITNSDYTTKIKKTDIIYKNVNFGDLFEVCLHFYHYLFFGKYDLLKADTILNTIKQGVENGK